tara:strand:+ start:193 stop:324 length:132 start_codon:yes stop_codon:yes gene_type:complete
MSMWSFASLRGVMNTSLPVVRDLILWLVLELMVYEYYLEKVLK